VKLKSNADFLLGCSLQLWKSSEFMLLSYELLVFYYPKRKTDDRTSIQFHFTEISSQVDLHTNTVQELVDLNIQKNVHAYDAALCLVYQFATDNAYLVIYLNL
jgi:hypothetical protein